MNIAQHIKPLPIVDMLMADIARKIQLSPTDYGIAIDHYNAVSDWLAREASPLRNAFRRLYAQGSMAIGATIASRLRNDEFDIDVILELDLPRGVEPSAVLDALFAAMNGDEGSRYHGKVKRRTRCITVEYDRMHLDITPAVLLEHRPDRTSTIFHAHEDEPSSEHFTIEANPWGFAHWFIAKTPNVAPILEKVLRSSAEPVPEQDHVFEKSNSLLALQLLKRWRNKCYDQREERCPPSVVLAYFVAEAAMPATTLFAELKSQAMNLQSAFSAAVADGRLIEVVNPACDTDIFTDRWPASLADQKRFKLDLDQLVRSLDQIEADPSVENCAVILADLFGEEPTRIVLEEFRKSYGEKAASGSLFSSGGTKGVSLAASGLMGGAAAQAKPIPKHTDFGADG